MIADGYIEEVEKCAERFKAQLEEHQHEIKETQEKVFHLLGAFFKEDSINQNLDSLNQMKISLPNKGLISSLFKDDDFNNDLFFKWNQDDKRKQLASERRAEYNAYLEKKERELRLRHKVPEEAQNITPKSILESVDYEKVLAKMKEEESKFRNLNHAETRLEEHVKKPPTPIHKSVEYFPEEKTPRNLNHAETRLEEHVKKPPTPMHRSVEYFPEEKTPRLYIEPKMNSLQEPSIPFLRTGGGGEPVKDSFGNLITARGFKDTSSVLPGFPSSFQGISVNKSSYREELRKQIEEKKRLEALEKQKAQQLEDQINQRMQQQRRDMQMEYENELMKNNRRKEQLQQERLQKLEDFQRRDLAIRNQKMKEPIIPQNANTLSEPSSAKSKRSTSPPVPAVRSKVILERTVTPVVTTTKALNEAKPDNIFSSLAKIRSTIMKDQQNLKKDFKDSYEVTNRRTVSNVLDDYEEELK